MTIRLAVIPGDGIGPEVVAEARRVLDAVLATGTGNEPDAEQPQAVLTTEYDLGARRWHSTGELLPDSVLAEIAAHDAILLGAVGDPTVPPGLLERGLLLKLRFELDHHVNLRPARGYLGVPSPLAGRADDAIDLLVVREGTEGPYGGAGGVLRRGTAHEVATEESINTAYGVERVVRYAFTRAAARPRQRLTLVHKTNIMPFAGALWQRITDEVAAGFPQVQVDYLHVDAAAMFLVTDPLRFDVIVTDNLFGDILTDLGAAVTGGIGLAASANLDTTKANPSMFEPVHGSAPDIAGQGRADPTAAILSVALLLEHLDLLDAAERVRLAVAADIAGRAGSASRRTRAVGEAIAERVTHESPTD